MLCQGRAALGFMWVPCGRTSLLKCCQPWACLRLPAMPAQATPPPSWWGGSLTPLTFLGHVSQQTQHAHRPWWLRIWHRRVSLTCISQAVPTSGSLARCELIVCLMWTVARIVESRIAMKAAVSRICMEAQCHHTQASCCIMTGQDCVISALLSMTYLSLGSVICIRFAVSAGQGMIWLGKGMRNTAW